MNWFRQFFTRRRIYSDLSEEIEQHLVEKMEALMTGGMSREDAEHAAKREFGNVARIKERSRAQRSHPPSAGCTSTRKPLSVVHGNGKTGWISQSYRDYLDYRDRDASFSGLMAYQMQRVGLSVPIIVQPPRK